MRKIEMLKAREILRLKYESDLSLREIAGAANCGKSTVSEVLKRAKASQIKWPCKLSDKQLISTLYPSRETEERTPEPDIEWIVKEIKRKGVTLMLLWEEYKAQNPDGIMYTQFCERYREFKKQNKLTYRKEHKGGETMEVDWSGMTLKYKEPFSKIEKTAYIFVSVLPASSYPFAYAYEDTKLENWIDAHIRAFKFYGGVPSVLIPDNAKTAVINPDKYDPVLNRTYREMGSYYQAAIVPARSAKPKDKGADENQVKITEQRILAPLRHMQFFSLEEINDAISVQLEKVIEKPFQKLDFNRRTLFREIEEPYLRPLPQKHFEICSWEKGRVGFNYHVEHDRIFYYSVPYELAGKEVWIRATAKTVEIFHDGGRVACHSRNYNKYQRYRTLEEHMPHEHKAVTDWNTGRFLSWARKTGPETEAYIKEVLESRDFPQQAYSTCMAIMRLSDTVSAASMEKACREALKSRIYGYKYFSSILKRISCLERQTEKDQIIAHGNIRGKQAYEGGGINAN